MKILTLTDIEREQCGFTHKVNLTFADLTTAGATQTFSILPKTGAVQSADAIVRSAIRLITPFTGGAISAMVIDIGDGESVGRYIANSATDLFTAAATNAKNNVISLTAYAYSGKNVADGNTVVQAKFTATGGNVNAATAGEVDIYLSLQQLSDLGKPK